MSKRTHDELIDLSDDDSTSQDDGGAADGAAKRPRETLFSCFPRSSNFDGQHRHHPKDDHITRQMNIINSKEKPGMLQMLERMMLQTAQNSSAPLLRRISSAVLNNAGQYDPSQDDLVSFLIKSNHSFDTIFVLGEDEGSEEEYLLAHRDVLLQHEYFSNMLHEGSTWSEYRGGHKPFVIRKPNIKKQVFYHVLQYVYCGGFDALSATDVLPLVRAAAELGMEGLFRLAVAVVMDHMITNDTVCQLFEEINSLNCAYFAGDLLDDFLVFFSQEDVLVPRNVTKGCVAQSELRNMMQLSRDSLQKILELSP